MRGFLLFVFLMGNVAAQDVYPSKNVRLIAAAAPGGNPDVLARMLAAKLSDAFGKPFVVENIPGAGGVVAAEQVARAAADGHTLMLGDSGAMAINVALNPKLSYNPLKDFALITALAAVPTVLVVHPGVPAKTLAEYLELGRRPDGIDYGTSGVGSAGHLAGELLRARSGARLNHVPFRGGGPAMNDLVGGHLASMMASAPSAVGHIRDGRIRALALTAAQRTPLDPDVPTIADSGFPGYAATNWYAFVVSAKVPAELVARLNALFASALDAPAVRTTYAEQGMVTLGGTADQAVAHIVRETAIWKKVIADAGIRLD